MRNTGRKRRLSTEEPLLIKPILKLVRAETKVIW